MTIEYDLPNEGAPVGACIPAQVEAADIVARYWNEGMAASDNLETIGWWLRQDLPAVVSREKP